MNKLYNGVVDHDISIQMKRKKPTKAKLKLQIEKQTLWSPWFIPKYVSVVNYI